MEMIVTINGCQWKCTLASTFSELTKGLSGQPSLPPGKGMLFDLGFDYSRININMTQMLFPIDIIFISSNMRVVGVLHNVEPNEEAYFEASNTSWARYFLEVNAGEAASVNVGDSVIIEGAVMSNEPLVTIESAVWLLMIAMMFSTVSKQV